MRVLSERQQTVLDRICDTSASDSIRVIGWLAGGLILETGSGGMRILRGDGSVRALVVA